MKKRIVALILMLCLCMTAPAALADDAGRRVSEAYYYTASLYYCDAPRNKVVLKNVKPTGTINEQKRQTVQEAEYNELTIICSARLQNGGYVPPAELNFYADSNVGVVLVRTADAELRVAAMVFR